MQQSVSVLGVFCVGGQVAVMDLYEGLLQRVSQPVLNGDGPDFDTLKACIQAAICAPDHRALQPWRFVLVRDSARIRLAELYRASQKSLHPEYREAELDRLAQQPLRAPVLVFSVAIVRPDAPVPEREQWLSCGAATQNLILALQAHGWDSIWRTGALAEDPAVRSALRLLAYEHVAAVVYTGHCSHPRRVERPDAAGFLEEWL